MWRSGVRVVGVRVICLRLRRSGAAFDVLDRGHHARTIAGDASAGGLEDDAEALVGGWSHGEIVAVLVLVRRHRDLAGIEALDARLVVTDACTGRGGDAGRVDVD